MRALVQRVREASVSVDGGPPRAIGRGLLVYLGVGRLDGPQQAERLADKALNLRIFPDDQGRFDQSLLDVKGSVLVVSQFTLYGDPWSGRRPDFTFAKGPVEAEPLYQRFVDLIKASGLQVQTGEFGAMMHVSSVNEGPVSIWMDTDA